MFEIAKILSIAILSLNSGNLDKENVSPTTNEFIGTWEWVSTSISGRGGVNTTLASDTEMTKTIVITEDFLLKVIENGKTVCEDNFEFIETNKPMGNNIKGECLKGNFSIKDGTLNQYEYLGCPSSNTTYVKK